MKIPNPMPWVSHPGLRLGAAIVALIAAFRVADPETVRVIAIISTSYVIGTLAAQTEDRWRRRR